MNVQIIPLNSLIKCRSRQFVNAKPAVDLSFSETLALLSSAHKNNGRAESVNARKLLSRLRKLVSSESLVVFVEL